MGRFKLKFWHNLFWPINSWLRSQLWATHLGPVLTCLYHFRPVSPIQSPINLFNLIRLFFFVVQVGDHTTLVWVQTQRSRNEKSHKTCGMTLSWHQVQVTRMLNDKKCNLVNHAVHLLKDVANNHCISGTKWCPNIMKQWVGLWLYLILDLGNDGRRITLDENALCMKFMSSIDNAYPNSSTLGFQNRRNPTCL